MNCFNPESQFKNTEFVIKNKLKYLLNELRGLKFVITLTLKFKKTIIKDETKSSTFYLNLKAETIIHSGGIDSVFESIHRMILTKI